MGEHCGAGGGGGSSGFSPGVTNPSVIPDTSGQPSITLTYTRPPGAGRGTVDTTPPIATLSGKKTQKLGKSVSVTVSCSEACAATATGTLSVPKASKAYRLKKTKKSIAAGGKVKLRLKLSTKARKAATRALKRHNRVKAKLKVTVADGRANKTSKRRTIKLKLR
jgi:hypothetical protein